MEREEYEKIEKLSYSQLKCALRSKREYEYRWLEKKAESASIDVGSAFHAKFREEFGDKVPEFTQKYIVMDEEARFGDALYAPNFRRQTEYQQWKKQIVFQVESCGKKTCSPVVPRIIDANKEDLTGLFEGKGYVFEEAIEGIESKGILDCYKVSENCIKAVDFKTTSNIEGFLRDARYKYHLDIQAYNYRKLLWEKYPEHKNKEFYFYWLVFSTAAPYVAELIQVPDEAFITGMYKYNAAKKNIADWSNPEYKSTITLNDSAKW